MEIFTKSKVPARKAPALGGMQQVGFILGWNEMKGRIEILYIKRLIFIFITNPHAHLGLLFKCWNREF